MSAGKNAPHDNSLGHVTGKSLFIDDIPKTTNEILVTYVGSPFAKGKLNSIDSKRALMIPGVLGVYTAKDITKNHWGTITQDQPMLVEEQISYYDEPICLIAAESEEALVQAKSLIEFNIDEQKPCFSIDDAISRNLHIGVPSIFLKGDIDKGFAKSDQIIEGTFTNEGQEHFYLESQASIVYPLDSDHYKVISSSQHPTETQHIVAKALGIKFHQVHCEVKRMGGGFGGKESQAAPFAAYAALCARDQQRPARLVLSKDDDMQVTGKRHPFKTKYKIGVSETGKIVAAEITLYADAGAYTDLSPSILERAMLHSDGCYYFENIKITGILCHTNTHPNTAFRGFGGPQGNMAMEDAFERVASELQMDSFDFKQINLYSKDNGLETPYGQMVNHNQLPKIFNELRETSSYDKRKKEISKFNKESKTHLKGIAVSGVKFGIAFTAKFLNQGNAKVSIHTDGSVEVSTGATEMGQGVNTKIAQIVSHSLGLPLSDVRVTYTSTQKNHNTSPTAASSGTDINGAAALKATKKIQQRLASLFILHEQKKLELFGEEADLDYKIKTDHIIFDNGSVKNSQTNFSIPFNELVLLAYHHRVSLGDYAFYKTPGLSFNKMTAKGDAFNYFTNAAAVSEVLIDKFTGEIKVQRVDILIDLGRMINPGIDLGQTTGAFIQGMGWVTTEKLYYDNKGKLISHSPTTYKIPSIQDTPRVFNVNFIENETTDVNVYRSKAVGEPPFLLSASVLLAAKNAISHGHSYSNMGAPATNEQIVLHLDESK